MLFSVLQQARTTLFHLHLLCLAPYVALALIWWAFTPSALRLAVGLQHAGPRLAEVLKRSVRLVDTIALLFSLSPIWEKNFLLTPWPSHLPLDRTSASEESLPSCGSCAPSFVSLGSCTSLGSVLILVLRVRLRCVPARGVAWATHSLPGVPGTVYCGCKPGPTRVLPMPRQYGIGRRAPALRTLATSSDFKETWFIDVSSCTPPRPGRGYDLVDFGRTSVERSHPPLHS